METYVITERCIGIKDGSCVDVCPVACIHTTDDAPQYYIDPKICIECEQCVIVCPVDAIYLDSDLPDHLAHYLEINAQFFYGMNRQPQSISIELASAMVDAVEEYAARVGTSLSIAVLGQLGEVVVVRQMAGVLAEEAASAVSNARTAISTVGPSTGAIPILHRLDLVGAVGVSGGTQEQNGLASRVAAAACESADGH